MANPKDKTIEEKRQHSAIKNTPEMKALKALATELKKENGFKHSQALEMAAQKLGFPNYSEAFATAKANLAEV